MRSRMGIGHYLACGYGDFPGAGSTALTAAWLLCFYTPFLRAGAGSGHTDFRRGARAECRGQPCGQAMALLCLTEYLRAWR